jgi:hypothetical protein
VEREVPKARLNVGPCDGKGRDTKVAEVVRIKSEVKAIVSFDVYQVYPVFVANAAGRGI